MLVFACWVFILCCLVGCCIVLFVCDVCCGCKWLVLGVVND